MTNTQHNLISGFDFSLIALAAFLAVFVVYTCIELTRCIALAPRQQHKMHIFAGAVVLGIGLWAAQLASMFSLNLAAEINYQLQPIILSLLIAIVCAVIVLNASIQKNRTPLHWLTIFISVGLLITGINIMGLQSLSVSMRIEYQIEVIALAALISTLTIAVGSQRVIKLRKQPAPNPLHIYSIALIAGLSLTSSYLLGIHALRFSTDMPSTAFSPGSNIFVYQILGLGAVAAFLLWASILFSRWQANEGIKIASQIAGLAFGLVMATASIIGAVVITSSKEMLTQQELKAQLNKLELEATQLQSIINGVREDAVMLAHTPPILGIQRAQQSDGIDPKDGSSEKIWRDRLAGIFSGFLRAKPDYLQVAYIGAKNLGREIVVVTREQKDIRRKPDKALAHTSQQDFFIAANKTPNYGVALSTIKHYRKNPAANQQQPLMLHASVPTRDIGGALTGLLVINYNFSAALSTVLRKRESAHYFSAPNGHILFVADSKQPTSAHIQGIARIQDIYPGMANIINNPKKTAGNLLYSGEQETRILNYKKIQLAQKENNYILRVTTTPYKDISSRIFPVFNTFSMVILALISLSVILASLLAHLITRPLKQMVEATRQLAEGNGKTHMPESTSGEFGILAHAFRDMIDKVYDREQTIKQNESFLRSIVDSAADGFITVNEFGIIQSFNHAAESIFGYSSDEAIGNNITKLIPGRFHNNHDTLLKNYTKTHKEKIEPLHLSVTGLKKDNIEFPVELSINHVSSSTTPLFVTVIRDLSQHAESETALRLVNKVLESTPEGIIITDEHGTIIRTNPAFEEITGFSEADAIGKTPGILKSGRHNQDFYRHMWHSISQHGIWQGEIWDKRKSGAIYPKWLSISAIKNDEDVTTHYVGIFSDISERKEVEQRLEHLAHYDVLTGLPNRALFHDRLLHSLEFARRAEKGLAVMMLDLDRFKLINDTLGHDIGDLLLVETAKRLLNCLRKVDTVARMGGDEFTVILSDLNDATDAIQVAKVIIDSLSKPFTLSGHACFVGVSIGISSFPADGNSPKTLAKNADAAMYRAKEMGRNTYQVFDVSMSEKNIIRRDIETKLRAALEYGELELYYQPQIDLHSGKISGMEVLLHWQHSELGMISPATFIPIAEESGLIIEIGQWMFKTVCQQYRDWVTSGLPAIPIMINLSTQQLLQQQLPTLIRETLSAAQMPAEMLTLEIAESTLLGFPSHAINMLEKLHALGAHIAVDDFGTSYSSMSQLKSLPIQAIKIDQSIIQKISDDENSQEIIKAIVGMARNLNLQVVAEGVESMEQLAFLKLQGCDAMQGYLYCPPLPLKAISYMLKNDVSPSLLSSPI